MKKKITKALIPLLLLSLICLSACGYVSHYRTVGCVRTNTGSEAKLSFFELEGTIVFKMRLKDRSESAIRYSAELETGEATVYYDYMGQKTKLFTVRGGESVEDTGGYVENGPVTLIVETDGTCKNGSFHFSFAE